MSNIHSNFPLNFSNIKLFITFNILNNLFYNVTVIGIVKKKNSFKKSFSVFAYLLRSILTHSSSFLGTQMVNKDKFLITVQKKKKKKIVNFCDLFHKQ